MDIHVEQNERFRTVFAMGSDGPKPLTTVINCKSIYLAQESIGITIDVSETFKRTNTISINGVEFAKTDAREELIKKYKQKMAEVIDNDDEEIGHYNCDMVLCELLREIGFDEVVDIYSEQHKWYA